MSGKKGMHDRTYKDPVIRARILKKIESSQIAHMIVKYVETGEGMDKDRAQIGLGLLRKVLPDLASAELTVENVSYIKDLAVIEQAKDEQPDPAIAVH